MAKRRGMPPPGFAHAEAPAGMPPVLAATLAAGWRLADEAGAVVHDSGAIINLAPELPPGTRLAYTVPAVAAADPATRSAPERELARHVQIVLPRGADADGVLARAAKWRCFERVLPAPRVALP